MDAEDLKKIIEYLRNKVILIENEVEHSTSIQYQSPTETEIVSSGLNSAAINKIIDAEWYEEMVNDVIETPEFCEPDDSPQQILDYAKDVVSEYIKKRFTL